ncbi:hypothetical protein [Paractinoplanes durhamensis]|uniref:Fibronectin type-III domain-containing protein n=1 Tax=Paractinoplanes durhamensis TaxID=113563 RepID=A0ABQ3YP67_9ACTN|nr:hypothetical protein [Actinoplanes durhamensis]GID99370.1 hypothetical protein Adu01nite_07210 [Actinoplanes durhamensis]
MKFLIGAAVVLALGVGGTALAYAGGWTITGNAAVSAKVAKMPRGVTPSAAEQSGRAVVSWSAQEITDGVLMDHYVVTAHSVDDPPLPDIARTVAASGSATETVAFPAAELAGGRWYWTIAPLYRTWTGEESGKSQRLTFPGSPAPRPAGDDPAVAPTTDSSTPATPATTPATTAPAVVDTPVDPPETTPATAEPAPSETETTGS